MVFTEIRNPEDRWWHITLVFVLGASYSLIAGSQVMLFAMLQINMITRYLILAITGIFFGLLSGILLLRLGITVIPLFISTRNVSFFPACFATWLAHAIMRMQQAAVAFAAENSINFSAPFGDMPNALIAGLIILISTDVSVTPFLLQAQGENHKIWKYEVIVLLLFAGFYIVLRTVGS